MNVLILFSRVVSILLSLNVPDRNICIAEPENISEAN